MGWYKNNTLIDLLSIGHKGNVVEISLSKRSKDIIKAFEKWYDNYYIRDWFTKQESILKATDKLYEEKVFRYVERWTKANMDGYWRYLLCVSWRRKKNIG